MANDVKVTTKDLARSKEIFLREPPGFHTGPPKLYSVEEEFPKTRANRSPVVSLVVIGFVAVFAAVAIGVTTFINRASQNVPIGIAEFQDINLTDILDSQKRNESTLKALQRELDDLQGGQQEQIRKAQDEADKNVELAANLAAEQAERDRRVKAARATEATAIAGVRADFGPRIEVKKKEIAELQTTIDAYDSRMLEQAKKSEDLLNNQQRIFDNQRNELTTYYEGKLADEAQQREQERQELIAQKDNLVALLKKNHADEIARLIAKYNPVYTESRVVEALGRAVPATQGDIAQLPPFRPVLASEGAWTAQKLQGTRARLGDVAVVLKRLEDTPYINSVPGALKKLEELERSVVADYEALWVSLASVVEAKNGVIAARDATIAQRDTTIRERDATIRDRNATIAQRDEALGQFTYAMDAQTRSSRESGYILDPRNAGRMTAYVNPNIPLREGVTAYVFRKENEPVATVELSLAGGAVTARLVSLATPGKPVEPFDKILVQLK
jgi:hypothetical protein